MAAAMVNNSHTHSHTHLYEHSSDDVAFASFPTQATMSCRNSKNISEEISRLIDIQKRKIVQKEVTHKEKYQVHEKEQEQEPPNTHSQTQTGTHDTPHIHHTNHNHEVKQEPIYSSFQCSGGNQDFPNMKPFKNESFSLENKLCKLENVCLLKGGTKLMYFQHPEETVAPDFVQVQKKNMVKMGITQDIMPGNHFWINPVPSTPMPNTLNFSDNKTAFFILASYSDGVGHLLLDDLYPVLAAMDLFRVPMSDVTLLYTGCEILDYYREMNVYHPEKTRGEVCHEYFESFSKLVFSTQALRLQELGDARCFKSLVVGQNYVFNVDRVDKQRAVTLRKGRDLIMNNLHKTEKISSNPLLDEQIKDQFYLLILPKNNPGFQYDPLLPNLCQDVRQVLDGMLLSNVLVVCNPSGALDREYEMLLINHAAIIVAEHGTLSLLAGFYGSDGTVLITVGRNESVKSAETLPYALHLYVLFTTVDRNDFPNVLRYGVHKASVNKGFILNYRNTSG
jgi:hypothetical protein